MAGTYSCKERTGEETDKADGDGGGNDIGYSGDERLSALVGELERHVLGAEHLQPKYQLESDA